VASATVTCTQNVCNFDGRGSTDENPTALTYSWSFGSGQGSGSGPVPSKTYNRPGTYTPTLTVKDEWNVTSAVFTLPPITIVEPTTNVAPTVQWTFNCIALACATSSTGTSDPNSGDTVSYLWNFGDAGTSTSSSPSHTFATAGSYNVTLTVTDGWGKATMVAHTITLTEPANNQPPTVVWSNTCTALACAFSSTGTSDPNGDQIRYSWNFGDNTSASTSSSPTHNYAAAGTYTVTLTVTDGWNKVGTLTKQITVG
jgi:PKD repeat protein